MILNFPKSNFPENCGYPLKTGYYPGNKKSWKKGRGLEGVIPLFAV
jgi:hypothetical protein